MLVQRLSSGLISGFERATGMFANAFSTITRMTAGRPVSCWTAFGPWLARGRLLQILDRTGLNGNVPNDDRSVACVATR